MGSQIDFNCDMGESFGMYKMGLDEEVIKYITSANIACGFHAGDPSWMRKTVELAEEQGRGHWRASELSRSRRIRQAEHDRIP